MTARLQHMIQTLEKNGYRVIPAGDTREPMGKREREAYEFIREHIGLFGYAPTYGEIGLRLGIVRSGAHRFVTQLVAKKYLRVRAGRNRGIEII